MPTSVRITRLPLDGRRYKLGESVTLADPVAAKLIATGCAELVGRAASPLFAEMVDVFRREAGKAPASPVAPPKRPAAPSPKVTVKLKSAATVKGQLRNAGDLVAVDEGRAAMMVASGLVDVPAGASPRFGEKVAEYRRYEEVVSKRMGGVRLATLFS